MPLPDPLPPQFTAALAVTVRALIKHPILKGGRQSVEAPAQGALAARAEVDRQAGTVRITAFPAVSDRVATKLGRVRATVEMDGQPAGSFADATGHVSVEATLDVRPKTLLASASTVTMALSSDAALDADGLAAQGDPLDDGDDRLRLVGSGRFEGGTLSGGTMWLVLDCVVESAEAPS